MAFLRIFRNSKKFSIFLRRLWRRLVPIEIIRVAMSAKMRKIEKWEKRQRKKEKKNEKAKFE